MGVKIELLHLLRYNDDAVLGLIVLDLGGLVDYYQYPRFMDITYQMYRNTPQKLAASRRQRPLILRKQRAPNLLQGGHLHDRDITIWGPGASHMAPRTALTGHLSLIHI